jgi:hypothetical protein
MSEYFNKVVQMTIEGKKNKIKINYARIQEELALVRTKIEEAATNGDCYCIISFESFEDGLLITQILSKEGFKTEFTIAMLKLEVYWDAEINE